VLNNAFPPFQMRFGGGPKSVRWRKKCSMSSVKRQRSPSSITAHTGQEPAQAAQEAGIDLQIIKLGRSEEELRVAAASLCGRTQLRLDHAPSMPPTR
jgi:hypothetical protein